MCRQRKMAAYSKPQTKGVTIAGVTRNAINISVAWSIIIKSCNSRRINDRNSSLSRKQTNFNDDSLKIEKE